LGSGEGANVTATNALFRDDRCKLGWVGIKSRTVGRGKGGGDGADASIEAMKNGVSEVRVFTDNTGLGKKAEPGFCFVGRPRLKLSGFEDSLGLHGPCCHSLNIRGGWGGRSWRNLWGAASRSRGWCHLG